MILSDILTFLGRLHPMIVHLPLGFLILAFLFRILSHTGKYQHLKQAVSLVLLAGTIAAILACVFGYLLSLTGEYDRTLLRNHKWMGITLALVSFVFYLLSSGRWITIPDRIFTISFTGLVLLMVYTGHHGGMLTHGREYINLKILTKNKRIKPASMDQVYLYEDVVQPIFEARCGQCHGGGKNKGGLSMESINDLLTGGKSGPALVSGHALESELYKRITLSVSDEKFMPANGKPPLKSHEIDIIKWWIDHADRLESTKLTEIKGNDTIRNKVAIVLGMAPSQENKEEVFTAQKINPNIPQIFDSIAIENLRKKDWKVRIMMHQPAMLDLTKMASNASDIKDALADLKKLSGNIIWLNLAGDKLTEKDLAFLSDLGNLERLRLEGNPVSDELCNRLKDLNNLEVVNLNETKVSPIGLDLLKKSPSLKRIYSGDPAEK